MKILLVSLVLASPHFLFSQVKIDQNKIPYYKNEVGFELGGNCLLYAPYYQRTILKERNVQSNIRIGGSLMPDFDIYSGVTFNPVTYGAYLMPNILFFSKKHAWELGIGLTTFSQSENSSDYYGPNGQILERKVNTQLYFLTPQIGYRAYFKNNKFYFRTSVSAFILLTAHRSNDEYIDVEPKALPWAGFGFGYCFGKN
jgi:hypothetical protein